MQNGLTTPRGEAMTITDPLLAAINDYNGARDRYNAGDDATQTAADAQREYAQLCRLYDSLIEETPACSSEEGAIAALRLAARDRAHFQGTGLPEALSESVLAFYGAQITMEEEVVRT